ncbi:hypothetical protein BROUX41_000386 [Berkeleyomyces rouxiae]|uniref:uncharacterized protein n=1 Tax=Berkeleyomyces rouxiae TaxID=2035830 RepID=UPI003B811A6A
MSQLKAQAGRSTAHLNPDAQNQAPPTPISITICGDGGCGKSSITLRLVRSQWTSEYDPTIEDSYTITRTIDGHTYHLGLTDTAGQEEYRGMWAGSNLGADAFLLVYDITSPDSLHTLQYFNDMIDMEAETRLDNAERARSAGLTPAQNFSVFGSTGAKTVPPVKLLAGNKCDLQESRAVSAATGLDWARKHGCGFMETSARLEVNIEETFALIVRRVMEARRATAGHDPAATDHFGATKPLTPISPPGYAEKRGPGVRGPSIGSDKVGRGGGGFWRRLRCW